MVVGISGYVGNKLTGIGRVLINILKELAIQSPQDTYIIFHNYDFEDYAVLSLQYENIKTISYKVSKESSMKNILWHQWGFQRYLRKYKCDIAYIPNFSLLLWKTIPTIVTIHDLIEYNVPNKFGRLRMIYRKIADPLLAHRSDFILTVSQSSKNDIMKYLGVKDSKVLVIPNASDKNMFKRYTYSEVERTIKQHNLKYKEYLLFVGTIDYPGKNIKTVIAAFFNLKEKGYLQGKKMVIIGKKGFNSQIIYDFVEMSKYRQDVIFTGYLKDEDLPKYYAGAIVMLYLSLYEGFGLPVLEAMSCATPVICSNTSCFPEIVEELDVCVPPIDVSKVEERILSLILADDYRQDVAEKCYAKAQKYDWKLSATLYYDVFYKFGK